MKYLKKFENHTQYENARQNLILPNVSYCEQENEVHYNPLLVIIATDNTNLPLMNIARTYGWIKQDATEFYESEANNVTDITGGIVNTFVNTHTKETIDTPYGTFTLDLWYDKNENKWYDTTGLIGGGDFILTNISFDTIYPIKSQDGETASLYGKIDWTNIEHFNEFKYFTSVTSISDYAFRDCSSLTSITIPDSVTTIGEWAFDNCSNLTEVTIPNGVTSIGGSAFDGCSGLTSITIPDSVTSIGGGAFLNCSSLASVTIPNTITTIGDSTFSGCKSLASIAIPNIVTTIGYAAFYECSSLTSVTIPNSVMSIDGRAFQKCSGLTSVTIGSGVTSIGDNAFEDCSVLNNIISLAATAPTITNYTFYDVKTNGTLTVPQGSTGYDTWMGTSDFYLGKYGWTKVEQ